MLKALIKIVLVLFILILTAVLSYYKGYNDHRLESLSIGMTENYAVLKQIDAGDIKPAKSSVFVILYGEHEAYLALSKNMFLMQPSQADPKFDARLGEIELYIKKTSPEMWPQK